MSPESDLTEHLLGECLAHSEQQWRAAIDRACAEHPTHANSLRARFQALCDSGLIAGDDSGVAPTVRDPATLDDRRIVEDLCRDQPEVAAVLAGALGVHSFDTGFEDPREGRLIADRYELEAKLGNGSMGVVYTATDRELGRRVAIKFLDANLFASPDSKERFARESEALAALAHPHVVRVFDRGRTETGEPFLVMELLHGASLRHVLTLAEGVDDPAVLDLERVREVIGCESLPEQTFLRLAVHWTAELADALGAAHARGVIHRDVKPSNVFIDRDARALLLDFGIAARASDPQLTTSRSVLGTPWYMPPEQAEGRATPNPGLDVYALASTLYHLLGGHPPFEGTALEVLSQLRFDDPEPLRARRPDLPRDLVAVVEKGMEKDPARRYGSMAEFAGDLRAFLTHRPVTARPLGRIGRTWRRIRRRPARALAIAASTATVLLVPMLWSMWSAQSAHAVATDKSERMRHIPSLLAFEGSPEQRLLVPLDERSDYIGTLDAILALDPDDLPTRLWRAALALDQGDHDGAAEHLRHLATQRQSPYMRAVAARYAHANRADAGTVSVDLSDLDAEPATGEELFVAGFHELRNRHLDGYHERALAALTQASDQYVPARDLRLIALVVCADLSSADRERRAQLYREAYDEATRLEGLYGHDTARTAAVRGLVLLKLKRYAEAAKALTRSLELRPDRHGPLNNLGIAYRRLGDLDRAQECLERAHALRPTFANTQCTLAQVQRDRGEFAAAYATATSLPDTGWNNAEWMKPRVVSDVAVYETCYAFTADGVTPARLHALAERALHDLDAAIATAPASHRTILADQRTLVSALRNADRGQATATLLAALARKPVNAYQLHNLAHVLPDSGGLDQAATEHLRLVLYGLAGALDPRNPLFKKPTSANPASNR